MARWSVRAAATSDLAAGELVALRRLLEAAFAEDEHDFTDEDWDHATGGIHVLLEQAGEIRSHAAVVERELHADEHRLRTGYVEAVATSPEHQRRGLGAEVMRAVGEHLDHVFELGALDSGLPAFYERLGWVVWQGPTFVRTEIGPMRTAEEDGAVMVRRTPRTPALDPTAPISCEWRPGDVW
jgi:aminoglycoside 2'-N-acetyltransferase I